MIASANPAGYRAALGAMLDDPAVSSAVAIFVPPLGVRQEDVAEAISNVAIEHPDKPVLAVLMGRDGLPQGRAELHRAGVPAYIFPESAARALSAMYRHQARCDRPDQSPVRFDVDVDRARAILQRSIDRGERKLPEQDVMELLDCYGIRTTPSRLARTAEEAMEIATRIGFPVAMKIVAPQVVHKSDVGGVRIGIAGGDEARETFDAIIASVRRAVPEAEPEGVLVQQMVRGGIETIVGISRDASFGPLMMFGLGGIFVEALRDVLFRIAPLDRCDAESMVRGIRGAPLFDGIRNQPPADIDSLIDVLLRISNLALDLPEIAELDINPLLARADGAVAVDARVLVADELLR
jgi:acetyltransferase